MSDMKSHLFLFTIGPVQSFIAQARKTQDLYAGSQLLADLIHYGISYIQGMQGELIYPNDISNSIKFDSNIERNGNSYPNRIVAILEVKDIKVFAKGLENLIQICFEQKANTLFKKVLNSKDQPLGMCEQLKNFLEIYWVAVPYDETKNDYKSCFKELEANLAMVKNFRQIHQFPKQELGRKCNVDGQYNVKIYRKEVSEKNKNFQEIQQKKLFSQDNFIIKPDYKKIQLRHIQPGEGLSAISFFKRLYRNDKREQSFPSTATIALLNLSQSLQQTLEAYKVLFDKNCYDDQLLFKDNLTQKYFEKYWIHSYEYGKNQSTRENIKQDQEKLLTKAQNQLENLIKLIKEQKLLYTKYYALLRFDGDSMGKWLAKATSKNQHQTFSKYLMEFAKQARKYLDTENRGKTVYAGGDDFLGFVNLGSLFEVVAHLQQLFQKIVAQKVRALYPSESDSFTFSMGVVVAHYKTPLSEVIKKSKQLEDQAKNYRKAEKKKGNTGLCFMTSSTILAETYLKNKDWEILECLVERLKNKELTNKFIFSFAKELKSLASEYNYEQASLLKPATKTELARLMKRSVPSGKTIDTYLVQQLQDLLLEHYKEITRGKYNLEDKNYIHFLKLAEKLAAELQ